MKTPKFVGVSLFRGPGTVGNDDLTGIIHGYRIRVIQFYNPGNRWTASFSITTDELRLEEASKVNRLRKERGWNFGSVSAKTAQKALDELAVMWAKATGLDWNAEKEYLRRHEALIAATVETAPITRELMFEEFYDLATSDGVEFSPCEHGCSEVNGIRAKPNTRFCSKACMECEHGGDACSPECNDVEER